MILAGNVLRCLHFLHHSCKANALELPSYNTVGKVSAFIFRVRTSPCTQFCPYVLEYSGVINSGQIDLVCCGLLCSHVLAS